jgi:DNA repair exonuclease SbcCD ATPase subunit
MISEQTHSGTITLVATNHFGSTHRYELPPDQGVFVGSSANCGLQLQGEGLAGIQCHIAMEEDKLWIQEWMSAEGTRVNGKPITAKQQIRLGDVIQIGQHQIAVADSRSVPDSIVNETPQIDQLQTQETVPQGESAEAAGGSDAEPAPAEIPQDVAELCRVGSEDSGKKKIVTEAGDSNAPVSMEIEDDLFDFGGDFEEEETYDRETVALMQAEIEDLQAALAQRDAERFHDSSDEQSDGGHPARESDEVLQRMQELVDEANRGDERVAVLEEMLHASEDANRSEQEERHQLEAWVGDIEKRIGQREDEHVAELEALRQRLEESNQRIDRLQQQLRQAAHSGNAPKQYEETLENLQESNKQLQEKFAESQKQCFSLERRLEQASDEQERALREELAKIAKEQAKVSRMRYELSSKLTAIEEIPKPENQADKETAHRIQTLRQHLREIHEQEKEEEKEASLATRLSKLWKRVEY